MSHSKEEENCEFNWGKKRGVGGKKKEVQFYESFTYDGEEYFLYDSVYLYTEAEPEPYVGKLVKIWEQPENKKKIKVLWFFRPVEILNWLGDDEPHESEIFLASGEGVGLANVNPLEAIAGKCNVICTSKDNRNLQPSEEEVKMADYIFYRTFDVGSCTISDKIDDKIAGVEVRFLFNRKEGKKSCDLPKLDAVRTEENGNVVANNEVPQLPSKLNSLGAHENVMTDEPDHPGIREDEYLKAALVKQDPLTAEKLVSDTGSVSKEIETAGVKVEHDSDEKTIPRPLVDSDIDEGKFSMIPKTIPRPSVDSDNNDGTFGKISISKVEDEDKPNLVKDENLLDDRPSKKARVDGSVKLPEKLQPGISSSLAVNRDKNGNSVKKKLRVDSHEDGVKPSGTTSGDAVDKTKSKPVRDSLGQEKGSLKKVELDEKATKLANGSLPNLRNDGQILEVTRKPDVARSKWFKGLPWEERMRSAHEQGTLVLLENLDPTYTSTEIEDIIWHGFREYCTAKVVPRTAISSPHSGRAFVIFKTRDAAEMAIRQLDEGCLMLPNGRPLVAGRGTLPSLPGKSSAFVGHLAVDKTKFQMHRQETKQAVSTSHCSQPNTVEYDMAMEWCLLQARSDSWWKELYKQHGDELRKLRANLKLK